jgi:glutamate-1-semialdehyde 2,1-aminomutase
MFFTPGPVENFDDAKKSDTEAFKRYFHGMRRRGIFIAPAQFEAMFVSTAHGPAQIAATVKAHKEALKEAFGLA